jgi:hypothetical protein
MAQHRAAGGEATLKTNGERVTATLVDALMQKRWVDGVTVELTPGGDNLKVQARHHDGEAYRFVVKIRWPHY